MSLKPSKAQVCPSAREEVVRMTIEAESLVDAGTLTSAHVFLLTFCSILERLEIRNRLD